MKLTGPFMSLEASGSFANTITAGLWNHRQWIKKKPRPRQPRTMPQRQARARIGILKTFWQYLVSPNDEPCQAEWAAANPDPTISAFNFYIRTNLERWASGRSPIFSPLWSGGSSDQNFYIDVTPGRNQLAFKSQETNRNVTTFGTLWYLSASAVAPSASDLIWISPSEFMAGTNQVIVLKFVTPGTYYLWSQCFFGDGTIDGVQYNDSQPYTVTG